MLDEISPINDLTLGQVFYDHISANTNHLYNIYTMLDQRRSRWADVV